MNHPQQYQIELAVRDFMTTRTTAPIPIVMTKADEIHIIGSNVVLSRNGDTKKIPRNAVLAHINGASKPSAESSFLSSDAKSAVVSSGCAASVVLRISSR
jgi:hypothetical protein